MTKVLGSSSSNALDRMLKSWTGAKARIVLTGIFFPDLVPMSNGSYPNIHVIVVYPRNVMNKTSFILKASVEAGINFKLISQGP